MSKIEIQEWQASNLQEWIHRLQKQLQAISGLTQAIQTLYGEVARKLENLPYILESMESLSTGWLQEFAKTAGPDQREMSTSPGSILSGEQLVKNTWTAGASDHLGAQASNPSAPEAAMAAPSKVKGKRRSGGAVKQNGTLKGSALGRSLHPDYRKLPKLKKRDRHSTGSRS